MINVDPEERHDKPLCDWTPEDIEDEFGAWWYVTQTPESLVEAARAGFMAALETVAVLPTG